MYKLIKYTLFKNADYQVSFSLLHFFTYDIKVLEYFTCGDVETNYL
jgi:hypothetical protein